MPAAADFPGASQILIAPIDSTDWPPRSYEVDTSFEAYRRQSTRHTTIPGQRESINLEGKSGEGTVNTEGLWRIQIPDWSYGAGQLYADREGSVANRFLASTGVDVLDTQYQATLLHATTQRASVTSNNPGAVSLGPYIFWAPTNGEIVWVTDWADEPTSLTFTGSAFGSGEFLLGMVVDDHDLYIGTNLNLYQCQVLAGSSPGTAQIVLTQGCVPIGAAGGRVFVTGYADPNVLYDVTGWASLTDPQILPWDYNGGVMAIHPNPKWVWTSMALVSGTFYFAGYPSNHLSSLVPNCQGQIWRSSFGTASNSVGSTSSQNTGLPAPSIALSLPPGEVAPNLFAYGNLCLLGTTNGVRVCRSVSANDPEGNSGDLIAGPLLPNLLQPVNGWVTGFTANGRFVWFTWTGYSDTAFNGTITGQLYAGGNGACVLGRLDMETMVDDLQPAYVSDLVFAEGQGGYMAALAWDPISQSPMLSLELSGSAGTAGGVYTADPAHFVASGFIDSGLLTYNIPDDKIACMVSTRFYAPGSVSFNFNPNQGGYAAMGPIAPNTPSTTPQLLTSLVRFEEGNLSTVLTAPGTPIATPTLRRVTLKSLPAIVSGTTISAVLMLYSQIDSHGNHRAVDPYAELNWLESLRLSQQPLIYSEASPKGTLFTATCVVNSIDWLPEHEQDNARKGWDGVAVLYLTALVG